MAAQETTPISKAGISMSKNNTEITDTFVAKQKKTPRAFTFIEVMVALAIASISMLALIRLHLISINMSDTAELTSQAVFLAQEKIAELLSGGYPEEGTNSGLAEKNALNLLWQTKVTDLRMPVLDKVGITGLRKISADVTWKQGIHHKHLQITTYVADRRLP